MPMDHFLQHPSIAGSKASNTRRKIWWIAATRSIWKLRNDVIFHNQPFHISKLVDNTNFLTWSWLRGWEKDFNAPFHQWSSAMPIWPLLSLWSAGLRVMGVSVRMMSSSVLHFHLLKSSPYILC